MTDRLIGIDFGLSKVGLSISDPLKIISIPLKVIKYKKREELLNKLQEIANDIFNHHNATQTICKPQRTNFHVCHAKLTLESNYCSLKQTTHLRRLVPSLSESIVSDASALAKLGLELSDAVRRQAEHDAWGDY